jgi:hypothetical protein
MSTGARSDVAVNLCATHERKQAHPGPLHFDCHAIASTLKIVAHYPCNARLIFDDKDVLHLKRLMFLKLA